MDEEEKKKDKGKGQATSADRQQWKEEDEERDRKREERERREVEDRIRREALPRWIELWHHQELRKADELQQRLLTAEKENKKLNDEIQELRGKKRERSSTSAGVDKTSSKKKQTEADEPDSSILTPWQDAVKMSAEKAILDRKKAIEDHWWEQSSIGGSQTTVGNPYIDDEDNNDDEPSSSDESLPDKPVDSAPKKEKEEWARRRNLIQAKAAKKQQKAKQSKWFYEKRTTTTTSSATRTTNVNGYPERANGPFIGIPSTYWEPETNWVFAADDASSVLERGRTPAVFTRTVNRRRVEIAPRGFPMNKGDLINLRTLLDDTDAVVQEIVWTLIVQVHAFANAHVPAQRDRSMQLIIEQFSEIMTRRPGPLVGL